MQGKTDIFYEIFSSRVIQLKCSANNSISLAAYNQMVVELC